MMPSTAMPSSLTRRRTLSLAGGALLGGLAGCTALRECPSPSGPTPATDWPHPRHDLRNAGAAPAEAGPSGDPLDARWSARLEASLRSPLVVGDALYVAVRRDEATDGRPGVRAVVYDASTGRRRWRTPLADSFDDAAVAAADGDGAYVVARAFDPADRDRLYAFDGGGEVRWYFDAPSIRAAAVAGDVTLVTGREAVVVLRTATGGVCGRVRPAAGPLARWLSDVRPVGRPAVADGTVYSLAARHDVDREDDYFADRLVAVDPASGDLRWTARIGDVAYARGVAVAGGRTFVSTTRPGSVRAYDAGTGEHLWTRPLGENALPVAATPDVVVASGTNGNVALAPDAGEVRWRAGAFYGPPAVVGDRVLWVADAGGTRDALVVCDLASGDVLDRYVVDGQIQSRPIVAGGRAFLHTASFDRSNERIVHVADRIRALA